MQAAYVLFRLHNVMPSDFYEMPYGEKAIVMAFLDYELEQKVEEYKAVEKAAKGEK